MIHPVYKLLAARPELLAQHLGGYAQLARTQAAEALLAARQRLLLLGVCLASGLLGLGLAGVAALLAAALPWPGMPAPWLLAALPGLLMLIALAAGWSFVHQPPTWTWDELQAQAAQDLALLREAGQA
jgi:hypothetical protein